MATTSIKLQPGRNLMLAVHCASEPLVVVCNCLIRRQLQTGYHNLWAKTRFRIFSVSCLSVNYSLDGARNIPIFSRYFRQHWQKIKLQFDVKLRKRKRIATHINNCDDVMVEGGCIWKLHSYKKLKHLRIFAHWNLPCGVSIGKKSELLLQCSQRSFISECSGVSEQWCLPLSLTLSGNSFWMHPATQCSWSMTSYCQHGDWSHFSSFMKRRIADHCMMLYKMIVFRIVGFIWL